MEDVQLQTRTEHSRSVEDAERYKALETLKEVGLLIPAAELETYHGRLAHKDEGEWSVDPTFSNAGNDTGNGNVHDRVGLYAADRETAKEIAEERLRTKKIASEDADEHFKVEVHNIISNDADATIIDFEFDETQLDEATQKKYHDALNTLRLPMSEGSPASFDNRDTIRPVLDKIIAAQAQGKKYVTAEEIPDLAAEAGVNEDIALQLAASVNAGWLAGVKPATLVERLLGTSAGIATERITDGSEPKDLPINLEYVQRYLQKNHIVGAKTTVTSATVNRTLKSVKLFDLEKTHTEAQLEATRHDTWKRLGGMATALSKSEQSQPAEHLLLQVLGDVHAKPERIIAAAMEVPGFKEIFEKSTGNWEGFSLAEHTETVLRNFDINYADTLPVSFLKPMRLAIVAHDLGKPQANWEGVGQKAHNLKYAEAFFTKLDIDDRTKNLYLAMIGDGEELATDINLNKDPETAQAKLHDLAIKTLRAFNADGTVTDGQVEGFSEMCKMLQICDGGAYTSMATTRSRKGMYRNAPTFNGSFAPPTDLSGQALRLRKHDQDSAPIDQTPRRAPRVSRVRRSRADNPATRSVKIDMNGVG